MINLSLHNKKVQGFTLIEIMLVIALIGVMATFIQFNAGSDQQVKVLQQTSARFSGIFDVAAEYSMLNNVELGLLTTKTSYQFLAYDGVHWTDVGDSDLLVTTELPEGVELTLQLDDLPIDEPLLFDAKIFENEDDEEISIAENGDEQKKLIPQVYILSGGDITPFSLTFRFNEDLSSHNDKNEDIGYRVTGIYSTPLTIEGPVLTNE